MSQDSKVVASVEIEEYVEPQRDDGSPDSLARAAAEERQLVRKLDMRVMPMLCMMYLFACKCIPSSPVETTLMMRWVASM